MTALSGVRRSWLTRAMRSVQVRSFCSKVDAQAADGQAVGDLALGLALEIDLGGAGRERGVRKAGPHERTS